ncbi:MAG: hypothetical protein NC432_09860 [Roseburia sp.]|nr:hypothetical protein [Roseburia sp.]MCM1098717.1 hypothetical protein [Ruminococcus flavefaciens]
MQDAYVGDIGDYGKYGLLRRISKTSFCLAVNWYKVKPAGVDKQKDEKGIEYLNRPEIYRKYDPELFDELFRLVIKEQKRKIEEIEALDIGAASFFSEEIPKERDMWHEQGLLETQRADIVFLDPDNGLATGKMIKRNTYSEKHVLWKELRDYYVRGQSVILYQHRPRMTKDEAVLEGIREFNRSYLKADFLSGLKFTPYQNRYYFFFCHKEHVDELKKVIDDMDENWQKICKQIEI